MVTLTLYKYTGEPNRIDKLLSNDLEMTGVMHDMTNIYTPTITIENNGVLPYNYAYIAELNRYYFIQGQMIDDSNRVVLHLSIDVLKTYEKAIAAATGTFTDTSEPNTYLNNATRVYDIKPNIEKISFDYTFDSTGNIIMVTLKGT